MGARGPEKEWGVGGVGGGGGGFGNGRRLSGLFFFLFYGRQGNPVSTCSKNPHKAYAIKLKSIISMHGPREHTRETFVLFFFWSCDSVDKSWKSHKKKQSSRDSIRDRKNPLMCNAIKTSWTR